MWLGLFPRLAAGALRQHAPFRAATRQFSSTPSSSMLSSSARRLEVPQFFSTVPPKAISSSPSVISLGAPRISWSPTSFSSSFIHRAFSTSRNAAARPTYYGRSGRGWQPRPPKPGYSLWDKFRMRLNSVNPTRMVYIIMGINVAVFLAWQYSINSWQRFRDSAPVQWMSKNFVLSPKNIKEGRLWTAITATFSQKEASHIIVNLLGLYFMAPVAASAVGSAAFLGLYLVGGMVAAGASLAMQTLAPRTDRYGSVGASGAIYTCLAFYAGMFPRDKLYMWAIIPMPGWVAVGGILAWDLWGVLRTPHGMSDSAGHIGGLVTGILAALAYRRGIWRPKFP